MQNIPKEVEEIIPSKELLVNTVKEFLRVGILAVIPVLISQLESQKVDWKTIGVVFVVAILKAVDRGIHELGRKTNNTNLEKSILRF